MTRYLSTIVDAPAHVVAPALARTARDARNTRCDDRPRACGGDRGADAPWRLRAGPAEVRWADAGRSVDAPVPSAAWPVYRIHGAVGRRLRHVRIELEVVPWSDARSELGIRVLGRRARVPAWYGPAVRAALRALARSIEVRMARGAMVG